MTNPATLLGLLFTSLALCSMSPATAQAQQTGAAKMKAPVLDAKQMTLLGLSGKSFKKKGKGQWTVDGGVTIYGSWERAKDIRGFVGPTPVFVAVGKDGRISRVVLAPNYETEEYLQIIYDEGLLNRWQGKTVKQAQTYTPDAVSGATYTSRAIIGNVKAAVKDAK